MRARPRATARPPATRNDGATLTRPLRRIRSSTVTWPEMRSSDRCGTGIHIATGTVGCSARADDKTELRMDANPPAPAAASTPAASNATPGFTRSSRMARNLPAAPRSCVHWPEPTVLDEP